MRGREELNSYIVVAPLVLFLGWLLFQIAFPNLRLGSGAVQGVQNEHLTQIIVTLVQYGAACITAIMVATTAYSVYFTRKHGRLTKE
jgi:hypothetical protein